ncbi:MAG: hypothetical protein ABI703_04450 [Gemmatimonadales bacterium]
MTIPVVNQPFRLVGCGSVATFGIERRSIWRLAALSTLALMGPVVLRAQIGLASGPSSILLIAAVPPKASISGVGSAREATRRGNLREQTVVLRLSANTGYRLLVVGTAPVGSSAGPASRLWVRGECGRFEEVTPGGAVTVLRGRQAVADWEPGVTFRSEDFEPVESPHGISVRYEVRIDPTI